MSDQWKFLDDVDGDDAVEMQKASQGGWSFEKAGVPDTPANRAYFEGLGAQELPEGAVWDIPFND